MRRRMCERSYIDKAISLPPRVVWRKTRGKVKGHLKRHLGWLRARLLGIDLSDAEFLHTLEGRFTSAGTFFDHLAARGEP